MCSLTSCSLTMWPQLHHMTFRFATYCSDLDGLLNAMELLDGETREDFYEVM